jgi:hypothetical protein
MPHEGIAKTAQFHECDDSGCTITVEYDATGQIDIASY